MLFLPFVREEQTELLRALRLTNVVLARTGLDPAVLLAEDHALDERLEAFSWLIDS